MSEQYQKVYADFDGKTVKSINATIADADEIGGNMLIVFTDGSQLEMITCGCCDGIGCFAR